MSQYAAIRAQAFVDKDIKLPSVSILRRDVIVKIGKEMTMGNVLQT